MERASRSEKSSLKPAFFLLASRGRSFCKINLGENEPTVHWWVRGLVTTLILILDLWYLITVLILYNWEARPSRHYTSLTSQWAVSRWWRPSFVYSLCSQRLGFFLMLCALYLQTVVVIWVHKKEIKLNLLIFYSLDFMWCFICADASVNIYFIVVFLPSSFFHYFLILL